MIIPMIFVACFRTYVEMSNKLFCRPLIGLWTSIINEFVPLFRTVSSAVGEFFECLWVGPRRTITEGIKTYANEVVADVEQPEPVQTQMATVPVMTASMVAPQQVVMVPQVSV